VNITVVLLSDMKLYNMLWWGTQCTDVDWCEAYT